MEFKQHSGRTRFRMKFSTDPEHTLAELIDAETGRQLNLDVSKQHCCLSASQEQQLFQIESIRQQSPSLGNLDIVLIEMN